MSNATNILLLFGGDSGIAPPPPGSDFLITDASEDLTTDDGDEFITD